ncbi:MAG: heme NO-binding domain-containing protein [Paracoccaceae bacterium]
MHGLINRSIQCFVRDTYGQPIWEAVARQVGMGHGGYEAMLSHEPGMTPRIVEAAQQVLGHPRDTMLEDLGTYLVSHPNMEALRRLLRFGGVDFLEFLHSLPMLRERARLAVEDLNLPELELSDEGDGVFTLTATVPMAGVGHVIMGLMRAMADDYGALVMLDHLGCVDGLEVMSVHLLDHEYTSGRHFDLAVRAG